MLSPMKVSGEDAEGDEDASDFEFEVGVCAFVMFLRECMWRCPGWMNEWTHPMNERLVHPLPDYSTLIPTE